MPMAPSRGRSREEARRGSPHGPPYNLRVLLVDLVVICCYSGIGLHVVGSLYFYILPCNNLTRLPIFFGGSSNRGITRFK